MRLFIILISTVLGVAVSERNCTQPGIILSSDPHKFLVCALRNGTLQTIVNECSKGLVFDIVHKKCTSLKMTSLLALGNNDTTLLATVGSSGISSPPVEPPLPCKNPGAMCDTCSTLSFCVGTPAAPGAILPYNTQKILTLTCEPGSVCVTGAGCLKLSAPLKNGTGLCKQGSFRCGDVGTYPDLYDCTKYHRCETDASGQLIDTPGQCTGSEYRNRWSPVNSQCGWPENVEACRKYPVPLCTYELEMGSAGGQIYYICIVDKTKNTLSPVMFRCQRDFVFDPSSYSCRGTDVTTTTPP
uniref:Chitin-binding type-2 domain-containing protein n=1 Tax=Lygus hesperus TaxID=30085 RepID=A0A146LTY6_LYGHE